MDVARITGVFVMLLIVLGSTVGPASANGGGFDEWGYNYQARMFDGDYCDAYQGAGWCQPYVGTRVIMKWSDAWLSNKDRDGDGELNDRHWGYDSYIGSGAWITNHMWGEYEGEDGNVYSWNYFVKIVAKPTAEYDCEDNGGYEIWNDFCVIQEVYNDTGTGEHGILLQAVPVGLGGY